MSLIQFDDLYEICCEMASMPEKPKPVTVIKEDDYWWEKVAQEVEEVLQEEKKEILTV